MHAIAHSLGALYDKHHGLLNAILMPYVLKANQSAIEDKLTVASKHLDLPEQNFESFLAWVYELRALLEIPNTLAEIGIDIKEATLVGEMAERDPSASGNPVAFSSLQYSEIFTKAVEGEL